MRQAVAGGCAENKGTLALDWGVAALISVCASAAHAKYAKDKTACVSHLQPLAFALGLKCVAMARLVGQLACLSLTVQLATSLPLSGDTVGLQLQYHYNFQLQHIDTSSDSLAAHAGLTASVTAAHVAHDFLPESNVDISPGNALWEITVADVQPQEADGARVLDRDMDYSALSLPVYVELNLQTGAIAHVWASAEDDKQVSTNNEQE